MIGQDDGIEDGLAVSEVIRPAAILSETAARMILAALASGDVRTGGCWLATPGRWERWDRAWDSLEAPGAAELLGVLSCVYDQPTRYTITVHRAGITDVGTHQGWTVDRLCDEAFGYADLTLASTPRAELSPPPAPFRFQG